MKRLAVSLLIVLALFSTALAAAAPERHQRAKGGRERQAALKWFQNAKFGMFVHWGVYSLHGRGEWVMNNERIPVNEYEKLPPRFNPEKFDARAWVSMVKSAGMRYITITSKHHDGFAMFDSKLTDYDIVDGTPYGRDVLKELADECHRQGIKLFFYYSQLDWRHPDYYPRGGTGKSSGRPDAGDWERYKRFYIGQIRELCTNYGPIGGIWLDGWWDRPEADWGHEELYAMIHRLQPQALIANNHHRAPFPGEDFQIFEQDLPGQNTAGFNRAGVSPLPLESCRTINRSWGYNAGDAAHKPARELIRYLVSAAGRNSNLLLNTGPLPNGELQPEHVERYLAVGEWLRKHGPTIYGTRGGPLAPAAWGVSTYKGNRVFLHLLNHTGPTLEIPYFPLKVVSARLFRGPALRVEPKGEGLLVSVPDPLPDDTDTIIELRIRGKVENLTRARNEPRLLDPGNPTNLRAKDATVSGGIRYEPDKNALGYWTNVAAIVEWKVRVKKYSHFATYLTYACDPSSPGAEFEVAALGSDERLLGTVKATASWSAFRTDSLGTLKLPPGEYTIRVRALKMPKMAVMNLRSVLLKPTPTPLARQGP